MVITPHMLVGAAVGIHSNNIGMAFLFGLISHYIVDLLPHWEYMDQISISSKKDFLKIFLDFIIGSLIVLILVWDYPGRMAIGFAIIGSLLPDILLFLDSRFKSKFLKYHREYHHKIHYFKYLSFWQGLPATMVVIVVSLMLII
ncbi:MAG: hypothetical protein ABH889_01520 [Candidatus Portnoybacteria bacterium]